MSDWDDENSQQQQVNRAFKSMDVVDNADTTSDRRDSYKRNNEDTNQEGVRRRRNDGDSGSNYSSFNKANDNEGGRGNFNRNNDSGNQDGNQRRRNYNNDQNNSNQSGGYQRNNDNQDNQSGGFQRRGNDQQNDGGYRRRNNDNQNDNQQGGYRRRNNNDNQDNQNDNQQGGGYRRRNNNDNQDNQNDNQQGGGYRRRNNNDNQDNQNDNQQGDRPRRRNREDNNNAGGSGPIVEPIKTEEGEPKKERYIPRRYNKDDEDLFEHIGEGINFSNIERIPVQVSGENIPDHIEKFSDVAQDNSVIEAIKRSNYRSLTPIQKYGIPIVVAGRDLMASAQTGSGKTITFLLPIIEALCKDPASQDYGDNCSPQCLIVTPTRELAIQIYEQALKLTFKNDIKPCVVYGGASYGDQRNRISYGSNIVVATPGRLNQFLEKGVISLSKLKYFVLDEADRMIDQGFVPIVKSLTNGYDMPAEKQSLMFSATFPPSVQLLAQEFLKPDYIFLSVGILGGANADVEQKILEVEFRDKKNKLLEILRDIYNQDARILVFCERKKTCDYLASNLCENDFKTTSIHGDRYQSQREEALTTFKKGQTPVLIATNVAARGLDIKGVGHVINYDLPKDKEEYVHRIGRTGRVGNKGVAISFYNEKDDSALAPQLVQVLKDANQTIPSFLSQYDTADARDNQEDQEHRDQRDVEMQNENFQQRVDEYKPNAQPQAANDDDDW